MGTHQAESAVTRECLPRIAVVGCGAAAMEFCLPVLRKYPGFRAQVVLVDSMPSRVEAVARELGVQHYCDDYQRLPVEVEAAMVMTPHPLHASQSIHFLKQGKHVFVEKPLGMTADEVAEMISAANAAPAVLMVNNCRRLFPAYRRIAEMLHSREWGEIQSIRIRDGSSFEWKSVSGFYLRNPASCKGVLLDRGAHTIDILCWWLAAKPQITSVRHDASEGAEAVCDLQLCSGAASIDLKFSRLFKLDNSYRVQCERACLRGRLFAPAEFTIETPGVTQRMQVGKPAAYQHYAWQMVHHFVDVVTGRQSAWFAAADVAPSIAVIDEAYRRAQPFERCWYEQDPNIAWLTAAQQAARRVANQGDALSRPGVGLNKHAKNTGDRRGGIPGRLGGGMLSALRYPGSRWCPPLDSAVRLARQPTELVQCDILSPPQLQKAMTGCDAVVHCAVGDQQVTVTGTRNVLAAARALPACAAWFISVRWPFMVRSLVWSAKTGPG